MKTITFLTIAFSCFLLGSPTFSDEPIDPAAIWDLRGIGGEIIDSYIAPSAPTIVAENTDAVEVAFGSRNATGRAAIIESFGGSGQYSIGGNDSVVIPERAIWGPMSFGREPDSDSNPDDVSGDGTTEADGTESTEGTGPNASGNFNIGGPTRPDMDFDGGFLEWCADILIDLDPVCSENASWSDYQNRAQYEGLLRGAQAVGHLDDGTDFYAHFLYGDGADYHYDYSEYINEDSSGMITANNIQREAQRAAEDMGQGRTSFSFSSEAYGVGGNDPRFPYPQTENWQKAIGGHQVWSSADVIVTENEAGERVYEMTITYHAEDAYNFNPNEADIGTGLKDRDNGRFSVLGWADPFQSYGTSQRTVTWVEGDITSTEVGPDTPRTSDRRPEHPDR